MKLAEFDALCHREHDKDGGVVTSLSLPPASLVELANDILASDEPVRIDGDEGAAVAGARVGSLPHPVTRTPVLLSPVDLDGFTGSAEVVRWVSVVAAP